MYVSKHSTACPSCSHWHGRVYIDDIFCNGTKKDGNYPFLSEAIKGGLFHDGCKHGLSTYYEGINELK